MRARVCVCVNSTQATCEQASTKEEGQHRGLEGRPSPATGCLRRHTVLGALASPSPLQRGLGEDPQNPSDLGTLGYRTSLAYVLVLKLTKKIFCGARGGPRALRKLGKCATTELSSSICSQLSTINGD